MPELDLIIIVAAVCFCVVVVCLTLRWGQEPWWRRWRRNSKPVTIDRQYREYDTAASNYRYVTERSYYDASSVPQLQSGEVKS